MTVTITDSTPGATIYYTTDGSTPTTSSTPYTGPISVTQTTTIRAMAAASGMADSDVASATYTIQQQQVATPAFSPAGGTYVSSVTVTITDGTPGRDDLLHDRRQHADDRRRRRYTGPIAVTQTTTIRAMAAASGMADSDVASATYTIQQQVATPTFSPAGGTYISSVTVTITDATPGATIYYTTDGSTPTTSSTRLHRAHRGHADDDDQGDGGGERDDQQQRGQRHLHDPAGGGDADVQPGRRHVHLAR